MLLYNRAFQTECRSCAHCSSATATSMVRCSKPDPSMTGIPVGVRSGLFDYPSLFDPVYKSKACMYFLQGTPLIGVQEPDRAAMLRRDGWKTIVRGAYLLLYRHKTGLTLSIVRDGWDKHEDIFSDPWQDITNDVRGTNLEHELREITARCQCTDQRTCEYCLGLRSCAELLPEPSLSANLKLLQDTKR